MMKLNGVQLGTGDVKKLADFYTKVFGEASWQMDGWYGWRVDGADIMLGAHDKVSGQASQPERMMMQFTSTDVKSDFEHIKSCGGTVIAEPYQPDPENSPTFFLATLADPDGNYLQLCPPWEG